MSNFIGDVFEESGDYYGTEHMCFGDAIPTHYLFKSGRSTQGEPY